MDNRVANACDVGVQTTTPVLNTRAPILDHKLYNFDDSNSDWNFLNMDTPPPSNQNRTAKRTAASRPKEASKYSATSPTEDGYCSQEEGKEWDHDQGYSSPLKDAPSYQTYLALVPDLEGDSGPESPGEELFSGTFNGDGQWNRKGSKLASDNLTESHLCTISFAPYVRVYFIENILINVIFSTGYNY